MPWRFVRGNVRCWLFDFAVTTLVGTAVQKKIAYTFAGLPFDAARLNPWVAMVSQYGGV